MSSRPHSTNLSQIDRNSTPRPPPPTPQTQTISQSKLSPSPALGLHERTPSSKFANQQNSSSSSNSGSANNLNGNINTKNYSVPSTSSTSAQKAAATRLKLASSSLAFAMSLQAGGKKRFLLESSKTESTISDGVGGGEDDEHLYMYMDEKVDDDDLTFVDGDDDDGDNDSRANKATSVKLPPASAQAQSQPKGQSPQKQSRHKPYKSTTTTSTVESYTSQFNLHTFIVTFLLEILPPWFLPPLIAICIYGWKRGYSVIVHRELLPIRHPENYSSNYFVFASRLVFNAVIQWGNWACLVGFVVLKNRDFFTAYVGSDPTYNNHELKVTVPDYAEFAIFICSPILRALVVSTKYSFYTPYEISLLTSREVMDWSPMMGYKKMLLAGWCISPRRFTGFLGDLIEVAMEEVDVDLSTVSFSMLLPNNNNNNDSVEVNALPLISRIIYAKHGAPLSERSLLKSIYVGLILIAAIPPLLRVYFGHGAFGNDWLAHYVLGYMFGSNIWNGGVTFLFIGCSIHDFARRRKAMEMLTRLVVAPGIPVEEFLKNDGGGDGDVDEDRDWLGKLEVFNANKAAAGDSKVNPAAANVDETLLSSMLVTPAATLPTIDSNRATNSAQLGMSQMHSILVNGPTPRTARPLAPSSQLNQTPSKLNSKPTHVFFDIRSPSNAYAWMLTRRVLRAYGSMYFDRCQLFITFYLLTALTFIVIINVLVWTGGSVTIFGLVQICWFTLFMMGFFLYASNEACMLQGRVGSDRLMLKRELLLIEMEAIEVKSEIRETSKNSSRVISKSDLEEYHESLKSAKDFIHSGDDLISYEEEVHAPTHILGMKADKGIIRAVGAIFLTVSLFAYEGFNSNGGSYDDEGLFVQGDSE